MTSVDIEVEEVIGRTPNVPVMSLFLFEIYLRIDFEMILLNWSGQKQTVGSLLDNLFNPPPNVVQITTGSQMGGVIIKIGGGSLKNPRPIPTSYTRIGEILPKSILR